MKRLLVTSLLFVCFLMLNSCEKYQKVEENSSFTIYAAVNEDAELLSGIELDVSLLSGTPSGDCLLEISLYNLDNGATQPCRVFLSDGTELLENTRWKFDDDGVSRFLIDEIPAGTYSAEIVVRRWYHSASCHVEFIY